jgi:cytidyltransferase-like protein
MIRGFIDGCFDGLHYGHINALYEARSRCDYLVAGIHTDEEIERVKGKVPIYDYNTRLGLLKSCKFIDKVVDAVPYDTSVETIRENNCDVFFHGDDGLDKSPLKELGESGLLMVYKRTRGVSSSNLRERIGVYKAGEKVSMNDDKIYLKYIYNKLLSEKGEGSSKSIIVIKYCWDFLSVEHMSMISKLRDEYKGYELCVDVTEGGSIYNKMETGIMLLGLKGIDRVFFDKPKGKYNNVVTINTDISGYEVATVVPDIKAKTKNNLNEGRMVPKYYYDVLQRQYSSILIWLKSQVFNVGDLIVLDIDEVCLSNLKYFGYAESFGTKRYTFENGLIKGIKYIKPIFKFLHDNGLKYAFVTGRNEYLRGVTEVNLKMEGMDRYEGLYMCENEFIGSVGKFKETSRRRLKEKGYKIRGCIGDQMSDMEGSNKGVCFLIFNPFYETE